MTAAVTPDEGHAAQELTARRSFVTGARRLTIATLAVGVLNYLYSLGLTHALDVDDFAVFAAGQALLLSAGTVASASVPWVLARALARGTSTMERRQAIWFAVVANGVVGLVAGLLLTVLGLRFASTPTALVIGVAGCLVFLSSTTVGLLQGDERFGLLGVLRVADALLKLLAGITLVVLGLGATGALSGFVVGSTMLLATAVLLVGRDLRPTRGALRLRSLWVSAMGVAGVQGLVSVLLTVDLVLVAVLAATATDAATYQASMILSRIPVFLAGAISASVFPQLSRTSGNESGVVHTAVRFYLGLALPFTVALATVPQPLLGLVFPPEYDTMSRLLPLTTTAGLMIGGVNLITTFFQARAAYSRSIYAQTAGLTVNVVALLLGHAWGGVPGLAVGAVVGSSVSVALLALAASPAWRSALLPPPMLLVGCPLLGFVLLALHGQPLAWLVVAGIAGLLAAWHTARTLRHTSSAGQPTGAEDAPRRLRILHLGFEDWRKPGSGGGAVRTREVDERLARDHDVTVLVTRYRGAQPRMENGVRWVPIGLPLGYWGGILSYFFALPLAVRRYRADLIVEDFAAPIGSALPSAWSRRPLVAVVQWLNAEEKARQYRLPFHWVQSHGVRRHRRFVAVSGDLAAKLCALNPRAEVTVVPNGVPPEAFTTHVARGEDVVFLGRLEIAQKGLDLLLDAYAAVAERLDGRLVLAGDGPDHRALEIQARRLGIAGRVSFVNRVEGAAKLQLLAGARVVAMPSRFETFGIVAAEALACGTPVVAFEIPSLREVVTPGTGVLVPAFDVRALGEALVDVASDHECIEAMGRRGREHARQYDWDDVAARQEAVYLRAVATDRGPNGA